MGGKWTIYRTMGEESICRALEIMESQNLMEKDKIQKMKSLQSGNLRLVGDYRDKESRALGKEAKFKYTSLEYRQHLLKSLKQNFKYEEKFLNYASRTYGDRAF